MKYDGVQTPPKPLTFKRKLVLCAIAALARGAFIEYITPRTPDYLDFWFTTLPRIFGHAAAILLLPVVILGFIAIFDYIFKRPHKLELRPIYFPIFWVCFWVLLVIYIAHLIIERT